MTNLSRRKALIGAATTAIAAGVAVTAKAATFGNPDLPPDGAVNARNPLGLTDPGPHSAARSTRSSSRRCTPTCPA